MKMHVRTTTILAFFCLVLAAMLVSALVDLKGLRKLFRPPRTVEWAGMAIVLPDEYKAISWPGSGFPAYRIVREAKAGDGDEDVLYFSLDDRVVSSTLAKTVQTQEQCEKISRYCVAIYTEQATKNNPFCRALILREENQAKQEYSLDVEYEFDDSGSAMMYGGRPTEFAKFLPLVDSALSKYATQHGMKWASGKRCVEEVLRIGAKNDVLKGPRPLRHAPDHSEEAPIHGGDQRPDEVGTPKS